MGEAVHDVDPVALANWLATRIPDFEGPLAVTKFPGGQSNPTYRLSTPRRDYVMRAKPGPVARLMPSAHAIEREYRVLSALADTDVPVPRTWCLCEDESVIGRAFFVMAHLDGRILWQQSLPDMTPPQRTAIYEEMNRVIAALHSVDYRAVGLGDYGKPANYLQRQINRWTTQYPLTATAVIPEMDRLMAWLPANLPPSEETVIVHGDYRLDNMMFAVDAPRVIGVLDWELSTLGDPLADFAYHCLGWHLPVEGFRGIAGLDLATLGIPAEREYLRRYCERTGRDENVLRERWNFYIAFNLFRLAGIAQGIVKRVIDGTASSKSASSDVSRVRLLAARGWEIAQRGV